MAKTEPKTIAKRRTQDEMHAALHALSTNERLPQDDAEVVITDVFEELIAFRQLFSDISNDMKTLSGKLVRP